MTLKYTKGMLLALHLGRLRDKRLLSREVHSLVIGRALTGSSALR